MIDGTVTFGASGAVSSYTGRGISSVTKLTTGIYQIQLTDDFNYFVNGDFRMESGVSGGAVTDGSFVTNTLYQIQTLGTTNWGAVGLPSGLTPAVGMVFVATGAGGSGGGTVKAIGVSGINSVEIAQNVQTELYNTGTNIGSTIVVQTLAPTSSSVTTPIPASPANGSIMAFTLFFRNSSVLY